MVPQRSAGRAWATTKTVKHPCFPRIGGGEVSVVLSARETYGGRTADHARFQAQGAGGTAAHRMAVVTRLVGPDVDITGRVRRHPHIGTQPKLEAGQVIRQYAMGGELPGSGPLPRSGSVLRLETVTIAYAGGKAGQVGDERGSGRGRAELADIRPRGGLGAAVFRAPVKAGGGGGEVEQAFQQGMVLPTYITGEA